MSKQRNEVNAKLQAILAQEEEVLPEVEEEVLEEVEEDTEQRVITSVLRVLNRLGYSEEDIHAKLIGETECESDDGVEEDEGEDDIEAQVTSGVIRVLTAMGVEIENDEAEAEEGENDEEDSEDEADEAGEEALDEISDMVASYLSKHTGPDAAAKLMSRLTANLNVSVMAIAQRQQHSAE